MSEKSVRSMITLKGKAAEIWERIPKGIRSSILGNLLVEAYYLGKLDLILTPEEKDEGHKSEEKIKIGQAEEEKRLTVRDDLHTKAGERGAGERGWRKEETSAGKKESLKKKACLSESKKVKQAVDKERQADGKDKGDWLAELEKKISNFVKLGY